MLGDNVNDYIRVNETWVDDQEIMISTVWVGTSITDDSPPLVFETMVFGGPRDGCISRSPSEHDARICHDIEVAQHMLLGLT